MSQARRRAEPRASGHRPGCRRLEAGAGPGRAYGQRDCAERGSRVPTSRPPPTLRGVRRADLLEEETRKGGWSDGAK